MENDTFVFEIPFSPKYHPIFLYILQASPPESFMYKYVYGFSDIVYPIYCVVTFFDILFGARLFVQTLLCTVINVAQRRDVFAIAINAKVTFSW